MSIGGDKDKPTGSLDYILPPGVHALRLDDVRVGVSEKSGKPFWIAVMKTTDGEEVPHFLPTAADDYKTIEKVFKTTSEQIDSLMLYDKIGECADHEEWFKKAQDAMFKLVGKTIEYTIKKYKINDKEGQYGRITGYLDIPNEAIQTVTKGAEYDSTKGFDAKEELPF